MARLSSVPTERCPTGVPGFDALCAGGFVRNSVNVIIGGPGAGKTTFLLQFLYNGSTMFNENGLYVSFEPDVIDVVQDAAALGWDFQELDRKGKCKFVKLSPNTNVREIKEELTKWVAKYDIKRIALDPVSVLAMSIEKEKDVRSTIFELSALLKRLKVTVLLADEAVDGTTDGHGLGDGDVKTQFLKFLSDGLLDFYSLGLGGGSDRALRITKMRRTNHIRGPISFALTDKGMRVAGKGR